MIIRKPSIMIYTDQPDPGVLREICTGIEEEGIFYEVAEREGQELGRLAWSAANDSMLGAGIGVKGGSAASQVRGLKEGKNIEYYAYPSAQEGRQLGENSARAVKRQAFRGL